MSLSEKRDQMTAKEAYDITQQSVMQIAEQELQEINQKILDHILDGRYWMKASVRWSSSFYIKKKLEARGFEVERRGVDGNFEDIQISWQHTVETTEADVETTEANVETTETDVETE